jgi:hypothetical protein
LGRCGRGGPGLAADRLGHHTLGTRS